jgi:hypothetical protein
MKNKLKVIILLVSAIGLLNISVAKAEDTYAVVNSDGVVTNIIVCSSAVCGGGMLNGDRVVPQVANANGGFMTDTTGNGITVTESGGTFTILDPRPTTRVEIELNEDSNTTIKSSVVLSNTRKSFGFEDTIGEIKFKELEPLVNTGAELSVEKTQDGLTEKETLVLQERKTSEELTREIFIKQLNLINSKIQTLLKLLGPWTK